MCAIRGIREEKRDVGDGKDKRKTRKEKSGFQWSFTNGERMMKSVLFLLFGKGRWYTDTTEKGIYYVYGDQIPIQILVTSQLDPLENLWLRSLNNDLYERQMARKLIDEYQKHEKNVLYQSMMDVFVRANTQQFNREDKKMCEALRELMEEEFEAERGKARSEGMKEGMEEGLKEGRSKMAKTVVSNLLEMDMPIKDIIKATGESEETVLKIIRELGK